MARERKTTNLFAIGFSKNRRVKKTPERIENIKTKKICAISVIVCFVWLDFPTSSFDVFL